MERNELLDKFFEMKCKQNLLKLWLMAFAKPAYLGSEVELCMKDMDIRSKLDSIENEMLDLILANETFFNNADLNAYCEEYKISMDKQKQISKEVLGKEYTVEELAEKVERR